MDFKDFVGTLNPRINIPSELSNTASYLFIYWDYNKRGTWCSQIDTICEKLKIDYVFLNQLSVDIKEIEMKLYEYTQNIGNEGLPAY